MKKRIVVCFLASLIVFSNSIYANENAQSYYKVKNNLPKLENENVTFDTKRVFSGFVETGTFITFLVETKTAKGFSDVFEKTVEVGASGLYSETINLSVGENIIYILAGNLDNMETILETSVVRKSMDVKNCLKDTVVYSKFS